MKRRNYLLSANAQNCSRIAAYLSALTLSAVMHAAAAQTDAAHPVKPFGLSEGTMENLDATVGAFWSRIGASHEAQTKWLRETRAQRDPRVELSVYQALSTQTQSIDAATTGVTVLLDDEYSFDRLRSSDEFGIASSYSSELRTVTLDVSLAQLKRVLAEPSVLSVRRFDPSMVVTNAGTKLTEGVAAHRVNTARPRFNAWGNRARVCVISDGIASIASAQQSGNLPANVSVCPGNNHTGSEGVAMLEIVHDIAPNAELAFCSGLLNTFEHALIWSANSAGGDGCDVIVDDLGFLDEPRFQPARNTELINRIVREGQQTYVSSAGNLAENVHRGNYSDAAVSRPNPRPFEIGFHNFGSVTGRQSTLWDLNVLNGATATFTLQWSEVFGRANSDFDFQLIDQITGNDITTGAAGVAVTRSSNVQNGRGDPFEFLTINNTSGKQQFLGIRIARTRGSNPVTLSLVGSGRGLFLDPQHLTPRFSILGHNGAAEAISVAAVNVNSPGLATIQPFSSQGATRYYYDVNGNNRFATFEKPDVTAVDTVSISGAGGFGVGTPNNKRFVGTSASAPHVAGIAALIISKYPKASGAPIRDILRGTASPRGDVSIWGSGVVDAERALVSAQASFGSGQKNAAITPRNSAKMIESIRAQMKRDAVRDAEDRASIGGGALDAGDEINQN